MFPLHPPLRNVEASVPPRPAAAKAPSSSSCSLRASASSAPSAELEAEWPHASSKDAPEAPPAVVGAALEDEAPQELPERTWRYYRY